MNTAAQTVQLRKAHCLLYGATLLGLMEEEYYRELCAMADWAGAETRGPGMPDPECCG